MLFDSPNLVYPVVGILPDSTTILKELSRPISKKYPLMTPPVSVAHDRKRLTVHVVSVSHDRGEINSTLLGGVVVFTVCGL